MSTVQIYLDKTREYQLSEIQARRKDVPRSPPEAAVSFLLFEHMEKLLGVKKT